MEKEHISTVLLLSVLLTFMCPVLGIIPLYHSIEAWKKNRKSDVSYVISLKKAYSWTKRIFIALLIIWIVAAILFFGGYYFRFSTVWHNHLRNKHLTEHLRNNSNELATVRFSAFCGAMLSNNSFLMQR